MARFRSTTATICRPDCAQQHRQDTSTPCWISSVAVMSPWQWKTSSSLPKRSMPLPISKPLSGSESGQKAARMRPPQRSLPSWPTSSHRVSCKYRLPESSLSTTCARRFDKSNCATHAASWYCDRERTTHPLSLGLGCGSNVKEEIDEQTNKARRYIQTSRYVAEPV